MAQVLKKGCWPVDMSDDVLGLLIRDEENTLVRRCLGLLEPKQRRVLELRLGLTGEEATWKKIAEETGCPIHTLPKLLERAIEVLKILLDDSRELKVQLIKRIEMLEKENKQLRKRGSRLEAFVKTCSRKLYGLRGKAREVLQ